MEKYNYKEIYKKSFINLDETIVKPDPLIFIGKDSRNNPVPAMTKGEYSVLVGASKSKKTFVKSLLNAVFIGGNANAYTQHITSNRKGKPLIIDIDTEQGRYYAYRTMKRVRRLTKLKYEGHRPFGLRRFSADFRLKFIGDIIKEVGKETDLVFIDGLADLVDDVNDLKMANLLSQKLLEWTFDYNLHINCILHKNFGSNKPTGHVGSAALKKAESVIFANKITNDRNIVIDKNFIRISSEYGRGMWFEDFYMGVDREGLPFTISSEEYFAQNNQDSGIPWE